MRRLELIGDGSFGKVYKVEDKNGEILALKSIRLYNGIDYLTEATLMRTFKHPHINTARSIRITDDHMYIVQDLAESDLFEYIFKNNVNRAQLDEWFFQLLHAVMCLHEEGFIHGDIKPGNILVVNGDLRITDFTLTMRKEWIPYFEYNICSANYRPMEVWKKVTWNEKVDIWSLGCLFYFMKYKSNIFCNQSDYEHGEYKMAWMLALKHWEKLYRNEEVPVNPEEYCEPRLDKKFRKNSGHDEMIWRMLNPIGKYRWSAKNLLQKYYGDRTVQYTIYFVKPPDILDKNIKQKIKIKSPNNTIYKLAVKMYEILNGKTVINPDILLEVVLRLACKFIFLTSSVEPVKYKGHLTPEEIFPYEMEVCNHIKFMFPIFD